ncbi:MAG: 4a-hydroxytetrahydrobiopterin dehydratase [Nanoarchaeota archaeon]|nr:4a-hydroxytetrahydrobiopterin dehydratase [Nanoarchaeota archaeon]
MLPLSTLNERMSKLRNWALDGNSITKDKIFRDFKESMEFANKVAEIAEKHNHHPMLLINYNNVRMTLTTHTAKGLTLRDFDVAEEIDKLG